MNTRQSSALLTGTAVCAFILALNHFGLFAYLAQDIELGLQARLLQVQGMQRSLAIQYGYHTLAAFFTAWVCLGLQRNGLRLALMVGAVFLTVSCSLVLALRGILFEPFSGMLAILLAGVTAMLLGSSVRGRLVNEFRRFFVDRLSEDQFAQLIEKREPARLSGQREITVVSFRLINAGTLMQTVRPDPMATMSAAVMKAVSEFLIQHGAYIERCSAHGIVALYGFPAASQDHAQQACHSVIELRPMLVKLTHEVRTRFMCEAQFGIGIASGKVMCGLYGHGQFQSYGAIGEAVEMSEKLAALNATFGSRMLLAASTLSRARSNVEVRPMIIIPSATAAEVETEVHELLAEKGKLSGADEESREYFAEAIAMFRSGQFKASAAKFKQALQPDHDDMPLRYFLAQAKASDTAGAVSPNVSSSSSKHEVESESEDSDAIEAPLTSEAPGPSRLKPIRIGGPSAQPVNSIAPVKTQTISEPIVRSENDTEEKKESASDKLSDAKAVKPKAGTKKKGKE